MQFNSVTFLFYFIPLFLAIYYVFPSQFRNGILVIGSICFYYYAGTNKPLILSLLLGTTLFTYLIGRCLWRKRPFLFGFALTVILGILVFFKLYDGGKYLPAGLSFYLFQQAAYLIDTYRSELRPERNLIRYSVQVMMFPKVLMGPLMTPLELKRQVKHTNYTVERFHKGLQELILGLGLKVLLADRIGGLWAQAAVIGYESISTPFAWMSLAAFAMRLYFDFWGYSVMARGLGYMLGFELPENFLDPYASSSVSEFWRRWHAGLGLWFRRYLYIPLGGNRKGLLRTVFNLLVVWLFTGFWHGVGGNYLVWAMFLFFVILNERLWLRYILKDAGPFAHIYTVVVILISWVPFAIGDWNDMVIYLQKLLGEGLEAINRYDYLTWFEQYRWLLCAGILFATPLPKKIWRSIRGHWLADVFLFVLFWICVYFVCTSAQDPFMYFQY